MVKIIKYEKKGNNIYKVYLEDGETINVYEDVILKNNLLYKKELDYSLLEKISSDNSKEDIYNKCVKYISVRMRSKFEIRQYLRKKEIEESLIGLIIDRLIDNNLLNDEMFTRAFVNDKMNFTTMGPYKIELDLKKHKIDENIIYRYISQIDSEIIDNKINKQIIKLMRSNKKKCNLRNKIYMNLLSLGYSNEMILRNINNYDFYI